MRKRIFAALDISDEARSAAARYIERLRREFPEARVGWEKPEKLHLTMKFAGEIDDERLKNFLNAVESAAWRMESFKLQITDAGVFPSPRSARILWLGVRDDAGNLPKLGEILEAECERAGFAREKRSFKPHLTIGRIKFKPDEKFIERHLKGDFEQSAAFIVPEIVVYQSELLPGGSRYAALSKAAFRSR